MHPNADYAMGVLLMELNRGVEACGYLTAALALARPGPRQAVIEKWLRELGCQQHRDTREGPG